MATQTLTVKNFSIVPFQDAVRARIEKAFEPLVASGHLAINFAGTAKDAKYWLSFDEKYSWTTRERPGCGRQPLWFGMTGSVYVDAIRSYQLCTDVTNCRTCERVFRHSPDELGKAIAHVAVHEAGHVLGLMDGGADGAAHTADSHNAMFDIPQHKDYVRLAVDAKRTMKYTIVKGDTLSKIARRIGFWPPRHGWQTLHKLAGKDGKVNKNLLRSGDPNLIFPDEQIWIPDIVERTMWVRTVELADKTFTKAQFDTMRGWIDVGRTMFD